MKALITGASGQVGRSLLRTAPLDWIVAARTHAQLDLANCDQLSACIAEVKPSIVVNAAAFTAVDRAETEPERAYEVNALGVKLLAECCRAANIRLIHVSTDYVFDGQAVTAYEPNSSTNPVNVYGASKLAGERHIADSLGLNWAIVRTSWVYAPWGQNFVLTMLRLMRDRGRVSVVCDQIGAPTSALNLARFLWRTASAPAAHGILHYADAGVASWYDFAVAINEEALAAGVLQRLAIVKPISTAEYPTAAKRPALSLLATRVSIDAVNAEQPYWREALREVMRELKDVRT